MCACVCVCACFSLCSRAWPGESVGRGYEPTPKKLPREKESVLRERIYGELIRDGSHFAHVNVYKLQNRFAFLTGSPTSSGAAEERIFSFAEYFSIATFLGRLIRDRLEHVGG